MNKVAELEKPFRKIIILKNDNGDKSIVVENQSSTTTWRMNEVRIYKDELKWLLDALKED